MMCNKMTFASRAEAKAFVRGEKRREHGMFRGQGNPYLCPSCNQWHTTSLSKAEQRRRGLA